MITGFCTPRLRAYTFGILDTVTSHTCTSLTTADQNSDFLSPFHNWLAPLFHFFGGECGCRESSGVTCPTSRGALSVSTWPEVECQSLGFSFSSERFANLFSRVNLQNPYYIRGVVATRGMPQVVVVYRVSYNTVYIQVIRKGYGPTL